MNDRAYATDAEIAHIGTGLLDRTLPKPAWTHAAHFAATLWLLRFRPDLDLRVALPSIIRAYNEATGVANTDSNGYHETITLASLAAARHFAAARHGEALHAVCNGLLASPFGRPGWVLAHWSESRLFSVAARRGWCAPDLLELPFPV